MSEKNYSKSFIKDPLISKVAEKRYNDPKNYKLSPTLIIINISH